MTLRHHSIPHHLSLGLMRAGGLLRRLWRACDGVETIEFALAAVPLLTFLLGVVEFSRLYWTQSELQYAAEAAARCITTNCCGGSPAACANSSGNAGVKAYAAKQVYGISVSTNDLQNFQVSAAACGNQVTFTYTFHFVVGPLIPNSDLSLTSTACNQA
ncbi:MAG: TadE/TadG family type IV pilus assembly protein [Thiohalocapsa sp.]